MQRLQQAIERIDGVVRLFGARQLLARGAPSLGQLDIGKCGGNRFLHQHL